MRREEEAAKLQHETEGRRATKAGYSENIEGKLGARRKQRNSRGQLRRKGR